MSLSLGYADDCDSILEKVLPDYTHYSSLQQLTQAFRKVVKWDYDHVKSAAASGDRDAQLVTEGFLFQGSDKERSQEFEKLKTAFSSDEAGFFNNTIFQDYTKRTMPPSVVDAWLKCKQGERFVSYVLGDQTEEFSFTVIYKQQIGSEPNSAVISGVNLVGLDYVGKRVLAKGAEIGKFSSLSQNFHRSNPLKAASIVVSFKSFPTPITFVIDAADTSSDYLPVGTIIASCLKPDQFYDATKCNKLCPGGVWRADKSKWSPADGRSVNGSKFATYNQLAEGKAPDLRAAFLRGLNTMDVNASGSAPPLPLDRRDPDERSVGDFQKDSLQDHVHNNPPAGGFALDGPGGLKQEANNASKIQVSDSTGSVKHQPSVNVSSETRPKNVAVFYYIRIN
jgi:hypothetical protein